MRLIMFLAKFCEILIRFVSYIVQVVIGGLSYAVSNCRITFIGGYEKKVMHIEQKSANNMHIIINKNTILPTLLYPCHIH